MNSSDLISSFVSDYLKTQTPASASSTASPSARWWSVEMFPKKRHVTLPSDPKFVRGIQLKNVSDVVDEDNGVRKFKMQLSSSAMYYRSNLITVPKVLLTESGDVDVEKWQEFEFSEYFEIVGKDQVRFIALARVSLDQYQNF